MSNSPVYLLAFAMQYLYYCKSIHNLLIVKNMQSVDITTARALVQSATVTRAVIECFDGQRWAITLRGSMEFQLRSQRKNPKPFVKLETALAEIRDLGLRHAEIDFKKWQPGQTTLE